MALATRRTLRRVATGVLLATLLTVTGAHGQEVRSIALSFDDGYDPRHQPEAATWNAALLDALAFAEVRAIFYPAGNRIDSPEGLALVKAWSDAGHAIGNHTYLHANLASAQTSVDAFTADIVREEALVGGLPGFTKRIRFPYLKEGDTADKRDRVRDWLAQHGYRSGAVTIDTSDWYYDQRFREWRARHPKDDPAPFRRAYLAHLASRVAYYDGLSRQVLHRGVKHVMLLHTNAINAAFLPDILDMLRENGWTLVRPGEAYDDPVYAARPDVLPAGESLLWSLAKVAKVRGLRYPGEDDRYEKPLLDVLGL
jgi:peptidoglycan/xylan/chitin deacetylase (PgdA/CDA1 family)